jgi:hypothetical protein
MLVDDFNGPDMIGRDDVDEFQAGVFIMIAPPTVRGPALTLKAPVTPTRACSGGRSAATAKKKAPRERG